MIPAIFALVEELMDKINVDWSLNKEAAEKSTDYWLS